MLRVLYPRLFQLCRNQLGLLSEFQGEHGNDWNLHLKWRLTDSEIQDIHLLKSLEFVKLQQSDDQLCWGNKGHDFSVKQCYRLILEARIFIEGLGLTSFPMDVVWNSKIPSKVCFFIWLVYHDSVLTDVRFRTLNTQLASRCSLCKCQE